MPLDVETIMALRSKRFSNSEAKTTCPKTLRKGHLVTIVGNLFLTGRFRVPAFKVADYTIFSNGSSNLVYEPFN